MKSFLFMISRKKIFFVSGIGTFLFVILFFFLIKKFAFLSNGMPIPDLLFFYLRKFNQNLFFFYSSKSISIYAIIAFLDQIFPVFYSFFLSALIFKRSKRVFFSIIPFSIAFFDYLENIGFFLLSKNASLKIYYFTIFFTTVKWCLIGFIIVLLLFFFFIFKRKNNEKLDF